MKIFDIIGSFLTPNSSHHHRFSPTKMSATQEIVSKSFYWPSRTMNVQWKVSGYKGLPLDTKATSDLFSHSDSSDIKWRLEVQIGPHKLWLKPDSESNARFEYSMTIKESHPNGKVSTDQTFENYDGKLEEIDTGYSHVGLDWFLVELTLVYPQEALTKKQSNGKLPYTEETRGLFCDVKFLVEDEIIEAHRTVLLTQSRVFLKMFTLDTKDAKSTDPIEVKDASYEGFQELMNGFYGLAIKDDPIILLELINLAEKYDMQAIKEYAGHRVIKAISKESVVRLLMTADMNRAEDVKQAAFKFLKKNPVEEMPDFKELCKHPELLVETLKFSRANK